MKYFFNFIFIIQISLIFHFIKCNENTDDIYNRKYLCIPYYLINQPSSDDLNQLQQYYIPSSVLLPPDATINNDDAMNYKSNLKENIIPLRRNQKPFDSLRRHGQQNDKILLNSDIPIRRNQKPFDSLRQQNEMLKKENNLKKIPNRRAIISENWNNPFQIPYHNDFNINNLMVKPIDGETVTTTTTPKCDCNNNLANVDKHEIMLKVLTKNSTNVFQEDI